MLHLASAIFFLMSALAGGAELLIPGDAPNCHLNLPPLKSGEQSIHGLPIQQAMFKVFPRRSEITHHYTGCQTVWLHNGTKWVKTLTLYFVDRDLRVTRDHQSSPDEYCQFIEGDLLSGIKERCPTPDGATVPITSMASGCIHDAIATNQISQKCLSSLDSPASHGTGAFSPQRTAPTRSVPR